MKKITNKNNNLTIKQRLFKKSKSFEKNRIFFIEQLLGILQFTIKKGLKKKLKRILNYLIIDLYNKDNKWIYKFNKKLIQYKQPYKNILKRKKKWKRRLFSVKQKEIRVTPFLKKNYFTKNYKQFYRRRPKNFLIFLNSKEQMHYIKKIYIDLVKQEKALKFKDTVNKQLKFFSNVKSLKTQKKIGWIKFLVRRYCRKNTIEKQLRTKKRKNIEQIAKIFFLKKRRLRLTKKKWKVKLLKKRKRKRFWRFKTKNILLNNQLKYNRYRFRKQSMLKRKTNLFIYNKYFEKQKFDTNIQKYTTKKFFTTKIMQNYEIIFYSSEKYTLIKIKKYLFNLLNNKFKINLIVHPIQKQVKKITVLKSPHVNKTARNQYDQVKYRLHIEIKNKYNLKEKILLLTLLKLKTYFSFLEFSFKLKIT